MAPFQSSNDQNLFLMSKNCSKAMFEHERSIPSNFIYHNKYWFVTNKKLMIKTSFLDDRQELTLTDLFKTSRTSTMDFFCENSQQLLAVNQFRKKKRETKNSIGYFWLGSKYTFGLSYEQKICRSEFEKFHQSAP